MKVSSLELVAYAIYNLFGWGTMLMWSAFFFVKYQNHIEQSEQALLVAEANEKIGLKHAPLWPSRLIFIFVNWIYYSVHQIGIDLKDQIQISYILSKTHHPFWKRYEYRHQYSIILTTNLQ